ncbi:MAG: three-Cys-motif partner protein TcmP [Rhodocyclaceae bacterium]|nr:three-Cys-motif partner protein TcmP [Rhodocyclaceae bacterium]
MEIDTTYRGREHSRIKHELLKGYLQKLLLIVGTSGTREITYVDCFAGPWGCDDGDSMAGTSIAISLDILKGVRDTLAAPPYRISNLKLRAVYVEEQKGRHARLAEYLKTSAPPGIECHSLRGDYSALQDDILSLCGRGFAFFFIDPLGWTDVSISRLSKLAKRQRSELLITFMYDFLNRFVDVPELNKQVTDMLGALDDSDRKKLAGCLPKDREAWIVNRYRERLKVAADLGDREKPRAYHAVIKDKDKNRTKYHMVYITRHPKGIIEFAGQSENVDFIQRVVRVQTAREASGQDDFFAPEEEAEQLNDGRVQPEAVKHYWLSLLDTEARPFDDTVLADMLEDTGWQISDFQQSFGCLLSQGKVENIDARGKRQKYFVHFDKAERLRRTT